MIMVGCRHLMWMTLRISEKIIEQLREENYVLKQEVDYREQTIEAADNQLRNLQICLNGLRAKFLKSQKENDELKKCMEILVNKNENMLAQSRRSIAALKSQVSFLESSPLKQPEEHNNVSDPPPAPPLTDSYNLREEITERDVAIATLTARLEEVTEVLEEQEAVAALRTNLLISSPERRSRWEEPDLSLSFREEEELSLGEEMEQAQDAWEEEERRRREEEEREEERRDEGERRDARARGRMERLEKVEAALQARVGGLAARNRVMLGKVGRDRN